MGTNVAIRHPFVPQSVQGMLKLITGSCGVIERVIPELYLRGDMMKVVPGALTAQLQWNGAAELAERGQSKMAR